MNKSEYFSKAESWATDREAASTRSQKIAWIIAGCAVGIAMLEAVALAMLTPLKTVQPITVLVDRQTGYAQAIDPYRPKRITADAALLQSLLAQYVTSREGFDRATISADYRRVALWSAGSARKDYLTRMPATNPESPFNRYPPGTVVAARVTSVSPLGKGIALVRFDTQRQDFNSGTVMEEPWISVVRYRFIDAPMKFEDRLINPLGLQVTGYRRDPEAPQPTLIDGQIPTASPYLAARPAVSGLPDQGRAAASGQIPAAPAPVTQNIPNGGNQPR